MCLHSSDGIEGDLVQFQVQFLVVWPMRESIWNDVVLALGVFELEVILLEELHPSGLAMGQLRLGGEVMQGVMVGVDNEVHSIQVVLPGLQCMHHSQQFLFMCWVIPFCSIKLPGSESDWASVTMLIDLEQDSTQGKTRGISANVGWEVRVKNV